MRKFKICNLDEDQIRRDLIKMWCEIYGTQADRFVLQAPKGYKVIVKTARYIENLIRGPREKLRKE